MANTIAIAFLGPVDRGRGVSDRFLAFAEARGCIAFHRLGRKWPRADPGAAADAAGGCCKANLTRTWRANAFCPEGQCRRTAVRARDAGHRPTLGGASSWSTKVC